MKKTPYQNKTISIDDFEEMDDTTTPDVRANCDCNSQRINCSSEDRALQYDVKFNNSFFGHKIKVSPSLQNN